MLHHSCPVLCPPSVGSWNQQQIEIWMPFLLCYPSWILDFLDRLLPRSRSPGMGIDSAKGIREIQAFFFFFNLSLWPSEEEPHSWVQCRMWVGSEVAGDHHVHSFSVLICPWAWGFASLSEFSVPEVWSLFFPLSSYMTWKQIAQTFYLMMQQCKIVLCNIHQIQWYLAFPSLTWCTCGGRQTTRLERLPVQRTEANCTAMLCVLAFFERKFNTELCIIHIPIW